MYIIVQIFFLTCFYLTNNFKMDSLFGVNTWRDMFAWYANSMEYFQSEHSLHSHCPFLLVLPPPHRYSRRRFLGHRLYMCF